VGFFFPQALCYCQGPVIVFFPASALALQRLGPLSNFAVFLHLFKATFRIFFVA